MATNIEQQKTSPGTPREMELHPAMHFCVPQKPQSDEARPPHTRLIFSLGAVMARISPSSFLLICDTAFAAISSAGSASFRASSHSSRISLQPSAPRPRRALACHKATCGTCGVGGGVHKRKFGPEMRRLRRGDGSRCRRERRESHHGPGRQFACRLPSASSKDAKTGQQLSTPF